MAADTSSLFPGKAFISTILDVADTKAEMTRKVTGVYLMRAAMAGMIIGIFYLANYAMGAAMQTIDPALAPLGQLLGAVTFGFALSFILFTKSELLTSSMMITTIAVYHHRMRVRRAGVVLALCLVGNALGGVVIALLVRGSSLLDGTMGELVTHAADTKIAYVTAGADGMLDLFVRAIFCNFLINLAMLLVYNGYIKADGAKILMMNIAVMLFAFLGFEHSVANTVLFLVEGLHAGVDVLPALGNVAIALAGNFVGGGLLIGWYYAFANDADRNGRRAVARQARAAVREAEAAAEDAAV